MYLIEYKQQADSRLRRANGKENPYDSTITIQFLPDEFRLLCHALYFYNESKEERHYANGEKEEAKIVKEIAELEKQFSLISDFKSYGINEIINNNKE